MTDEVIPSSQRHGTQRAQSLAIWQSDRTADRAEEWAAMSRVALAGARVLVRNPYIARIPRGGCASSRASPRRPHAARRPIMPRRGFVGGRASLSSSSPASPWPLLDAMEDARDSSMATPSPGGGAAMHWTVSEPMTRDTDATSAVADVAHVSLVMATELLDIGAVYVKYWPEGEGEGKPSRWRRVGDRKYIAKGAHHFPQQYQTPYARVATFTHSRKCPLEDYTSSATARLTDIPYEYSPQNTHTHTRTQARSYACTNIREGTATRAG